MDDFEVPLHLNLLAKFKTHHGTIAGLKDRGNHIECLKIWCSPAFLDAYCFTVLVSPDGKACYLRKLLWAMFSQTQDKPFHTALEVELPTEYLESILTELGAITMNPFQTSSDIILDAALIGVDFYRGDTRVELSWMGSFEGAYKELEDWRAKTVRGFARFFPEDANSYSYT